MVFLLILVIFLILLIIFAFSKLQLQLQEFNFSSINKEHINPKYKLIFSWYILGKLPIIKIKIDKTRFSKLKVKEKFASIEMDIVQGKRQIDKNILSIIKKVKFEIKKIDLKIDIGTENAELTSLIVPAISTLIVLYLKEKIKSKNEQIFIVQPIYKNQNYLNIEFSGIFEIKINHIINIIHLLLKKEKKGVKEYERTSNRRSYDYSYE